MRSERHTSILLTEMFMAMCRFVNLRSGPSDQRHRAMDFSVNSMGRGQRMGGHWKIRTLLDYLAMHVHQLTCHVGEHGWRVMLNDNSVEILSSSWNGSGGSSATISTTRTAWLKQGDQLIVSVGPPKVGQAAIVRRLTPFERYNDFI